MAAPGDCFETSTAAKDLRKHKRFLHEQHRWDWRWGRNPPVAFDASELWIFYAHTYHPNGRSISIGRNRPTDRTTPATEDNLEDRIPVPTELTYENPNELTRADFPGATLNNSTRLEIVIRVYPMILMGPDRWLCNTKARIHPLIAWHSSD